MFGYPVHPASSTLSVKIHFCYLWSKTATLPATKGADWSINIFDKFDFSKHFEWTSLTVPPMWKPEWCVDFHSFFSCELYVMLRSVVATSWLTYWTFLNLSPSSARHRSSSVQMCTSTCNTDKFDRFVIFFFNVLNNPWIPTHSTSSLP